MKIYSVSISSRDPDTGEIEIIMGSRFRNIKEIAWHPTVEMLSVKGDEWTVTHIPTGLAIAFFNNKHKARRFALLVREFDWDFTDQEFSDYKPEALRAFKEWLIKIILKVETGEMDDKKKVGSNTR